MIFKKIAQLKTLAKDAAAFLKLNLYRPSTNDKSILISVENPQLYHRFFYLLLKFYQLSGYTIYYPMSFSKFRNLRNKDHYLSLIVKEKNFLTINTSKIPQNYIELRDKDFSPDYFKNYFEKQNLEKNCYHVPMSFHPFMYHNKIWDNEINTNRERINALFCYGNFHPEAYLAIKKTSFKVIPRTYLLDFFSKKKNFVSIKNKKTVENAFKNEILDQKFVFAIKENYQIEMQDVREILSYFNFYLCCPGVVMPLCHNVIEAMSVGTIPVIEKGYAEVMYPTLEHEKDAIIFENLEHLNIILEKDIFNYPAGKISEMKENVLHYYFEFLSPENMVENLNKSLAQKDLIYLQAEHRSVKFTSK